MRIVLLITIINDHLIAEIRVSQQRADRLCAVNKCFDDSNLANPSCLTGAGAEGADLGMCEDSPQQESGESSCRRAVSQ